LSSAPRAADNLPARPVAAAAVHQGDPGGWHGDGNRGWVPSLRSGESGPRRHGTGFGDRRRQQLVHAWRSDPVVDPTGNL